MSNCKSIRDFCASNGFSRSTYYNLKREGKAPREMLVGERRVVISPEAEDEWRRAREADAAHRSAR